MALPQGFTALNAPATNPIAGATYGKDSSGRIIYSNDGTEATWFYLDNGARVLDVAANATPGIDPIAATAYAIRQAN